MLAALNEMDISDYDISFTCEFKIDLTRKARFVTGGDHNPSVKPHSSFSIVGLRDSIRLCFMLAALNKMDMLMADKGYAYLNVPCKDCVHVICIHKLFGRERQGSKRNMMMQSKQDTKRYWID